MEPGYKTLAGVAHFFRAGADFTVPDPGGESARDAKPGPTDPAWLNLGHVDINTKPNVETEEIIRNAPGKRVLYDVLETSRKLTHMITFHELQNLVFELLYGSLDLTEAGDFNPNAGVLLKGWLKVTEYDQDNNEVCTHDVWVCMKPPSDLTRDDKHVKCEVEAGVLWSAYNTGTLAANPA